MLTSLRQGEALYGSANVTYCLVTSSPVVTGGSPGDAACIIKAVPSNSCVVLYKTTCICYAWGTLFARINVSQFGSSSALIGNHFLKYIW